MIPKDRINEVKSLLLVSASLLIFVSLISFTPNDLTFYTSVPNVPAQNLARIFGARLAGTLFFVFGWASYIVPLFCFLWAKELFEKKSRSTLRLVNVAGFFVLYICLAAMFAIFGEKLASSRFTRGGLIGLFLADFLLKYFGHVGAIIILVTLIALSFIVAEEMVILPFFLGLTEELRQKLPRLGLAGWLAGFLKRFKREPKKEVRTFAKPQKITPVAKIGATEKPFERLDKIPTKINIEQKTLKAQLATAELKSKLKDSENKEQDEIAAAAEATSASSNEKQYYKDYKLPTLDLLDEPPPISGRQLKDDLNVNARILEDTLSDFGITVRVTDIERGPVITRYELEPAPGVKLQRIVALNDDIALAMKAQSVRIVAPIPGKARVGIEVPNSSISLVCFKEVVVSEEFAKDDSRLTLAIGKDIAGKSVISDLGQMPHLLIAGTTGSGKTVCVNSLIMSLLYKLRPDEAKFILVDPKMVELAPFNSIPHLLCPVVTSANKVSGALNWVVGEMEKRYQILAEAGVRNIEYYNEKNGDKMPYIIVVIDELADLMAVAANHIETAITRLAQLSRAVGIHLILATQRPSVDVITGVIKANFPARISFQVASKVDSRTVLDMNGADKLLGKGDLLFLKPGEAKLIRAQGCLIKDEEIERVVQFIKNQAQPHYNEQVLRSAEKGGTRPEEKDELFDEAVRTILESNQASVSILQRRLRLGYTRAARLIDAMEAEGIIGPFQGSKPREILIDREEWLKNNVIGNLEEEYDSNA
jgi:S-DNA-T family DNA segregation ATPase FtsK/SpoIIIE